MSWVFRQDAPGLFENPSYQAGTTGTFAVIVGVSDYTHLHDPKVAKFQLEPLFVSALTAYRVAEWLKNDFQSSTSPLAKIWLLLAPTEEERKIEKGLAQSFLPPTFDNMKQAIRDWYTTMKNLPPKAAEDSQAFFFFSGHGLQKIQEKRLLLPKDFLKDGFLQDAISTENLLVGLAELKVRRQFFFLDACRNANQASSKYNLEGSKILNESLVTYHNPNRIYPVFYASVAGGQALQPIYPDKGLSLFGQALLEGFRGEPGVNLDCDDTSCTLNVYGLDKYLKKRIPDLINAANSFYQQIPALGGQVADLVLNEFTSRLCPKPLKATVDVLSVGAKGFSFGSPIAAKVRLSQAENSRLDAFWRGMQQFDFQSGEGLPLERDPFIVSEDLGTGMGMFQLETPLPPNLAGGLLRVPIGLGEFSCMIPPKLEAGWPVVGWPSKGLEPDLFEIQMDANGMVKGFQAILPKTEKSMAWILFQNGDVDEAVTLAWEQLQNPLMQGSALPMILNATILFQVQNSGWEDLEALPLWEGFGKASDFLVLEIEKCLRLGQLDRAHQHLSVLQHQPFPFTSTCLAFLSSQVDHLTRDKKYAKWLPLKARVQEALSHHRTSGVLNVFEGDFSPETILPPPTGRNPANLGTN